jgi:HSP20 family protein
MWESFGSWPRYSTIAWRPPTDIYETVDEIIVVTELAGVDEENMSITLFSDLLVVEGRREQPVGDMSACHQLGIKYGDFRSEIAINIPVDHENVKADYQNGLLKIVLRKSC